MILADRQRCNSVKIPLVDLEINGKSPRFRVKLEIPM